jgi:hypothetical protein
MVQKRSEKSTALKRILGKKKAKKLSRKMQEAYSRIKQ